MKRVMFLAALSLCADPAVFAATIYKCTTDEGVVFSQTACAPGAVKLKSSRSAGSKSSNNGKAINNGQTQPAPEGGDAGVFEGLGAETADVIIERVGPPVARYVHGGTEHWLYPNYSEIHDGRTVCPELLLENGRLFQTNWHPQDVMKKSAKVARALEGWNEPTTIRKKSFFAVGTDVRGKNKSNIISDWGQPDGKKIFDGQEIWEYQQVPIAQGNPDMLTVYLTFEGDTVIESAGN